VSRGVSACGFAVVLALAGHDGWPHGCFLLTAAFSCEPAVRVQDRAVGPAAGGTHRAVTATGNRTPALPKNPRTTPISPLARGPGPVAERDQIIGVTDGRIADSV
jgi:hypothetical protein